MILTPRFAFLGDTTTKVFKVHEDTLKKVPLIITECTFLEPEHVQNAEKSCHTHWSDLEPIVKDWTQCTFVLIHFSHQYKNSYIREFFMGKQDKYTNLVVWINEQEEDGYVKVHNSA